MCLKFHYIKHRLVIIYWWFSNSFYKCYQTHPKFSFWHIALGSQELVYYLKNHQVCSTLVWCIFGWLIIEQWLCNSLYTRCKYPLSRVILYITGLCPTIFWHLDLRMNPILFLTRFIVTLIILVELFIYIPITLYVSHVGTYLLILLGQYSHGAPHLPSSAQLQNPLFSLYAVWLNTFKINHISATCLSFSSCWCPPDPSFGVRFIRKSEIKIIFCFFALTQQLQISALALFSVLANQNAS